MHPCQVSKNTQRCTVEENLKMALLGIALLLIVSFQQTEAQSDCSTDLVENVPNDKMTASSYYDNHSKPHRARLSTMNVPGGQHGAWSAKNNNQWQWIQADFGVPKKVTAVVTKGRHGVSASGTRQWVTSYKVLYSNDGLVWEQVKNDNGDDLVFNGNEDQNSEVTNELPQPLTARFVRIKPLTWKAYMSMRFGVIGCDAVPETPALEPVPTTTAAPEPIPTTTAAPEPVPTTTAAPEPIPTTTAAPEPVPTSTAAPEPIPTTAAPTPKPAGPPIPRVRRCRSFNAAENICNVTQTLLDENLRISNLTVAEEISDGVCIENENFFIHEYKKIRVNGGCQAYFTVVFAYPESKRSPAV
ncbi:hypothetical protein ScPMuIL_000428 [Solemya velum]